MMRFFRLRVIMLSLFKHHKANSCFVSLCQDKAFLGRGGLVVQRRCVAVRARRSGAAPVRCADLPDLVPFTGIKFIVLQSQTF